MDMGWHVGFGAKVVLRDATWLGIVAARPRVAATTAVHLAVAVTIGLTSAQDGHKLRGKEEPSLIVVVEISNMLVYNARRPELLVLMAQPP